MVQAPESRAERVCARAALRRQHRDAAKGVVDPAFDPKGALLDDAPLAVLQAEDSIEATLPATLTRSLLASSTPLTVRAPAPHTAPAASLVVIDGGDESEGAAASDRGGDDDGDDPPEPMSHASPP